MYEIKILCNKKKRKKRKNKKRNKISDISNDPTNYSKRDE